MDTDTEKNVQGQQYKHWARVMGWKQCSRLHVSFRSKDDAKTGQWLPHAVNCVRSVFGAVTFCLWMKYLGNRVTDLCQIRKETVFGPSLVQVWMSRSKVRVTTDKKRVFRRISLEPLNGFATSSHERRDWSLDHRSDEFEGRGQRSKVKVTGTKTAFSALTAACVRFMFGKTSLASSFDFFLDWQA